MTKHWMATHIFPRGFVDPRDLADEQILLTDIAHALSNICRFGGHCREFYSVAQHSVHVAQWMKEQGYHPYAQMLGLFHDASEAYLGDIIRPLKATGLFTEYLRMEKLVQAQINYKFCKNSQHKDYTAQVKSADQQLLSNEARALFGCTRDNWPQLTVDADDFAIKPWSPLKSRLIFVDVYNQLYTRIHT